VVKNRQFNKHFHLNQSYNPRERLPNEEAVICCLLMANHNKKNLNGAVAAFRTLDPLIQKGQRPTRPNGIDGFS
jgi:hypothetical protein